MGRPNKFLCGAVFVLALTVASASQITLSRRELLQAKVLTDLKQAQEAAGIFVDDSDLFLHPSHSGRKLLQTNELATILANPTLMTSMLGQFQGNAAVSPFGYAPTNASYCLFTTTNQSTATISGSGGALPESFSCTEGSVVAAPGSFVVSYDGATYTCVSATAGRKLLQDASPPNQLLSPETIGSLFENLLDAVGLPVWNCVTATTPDGNTTVGETAMAVLNDLGVIAEHFLVALNGNGGLTYQQKVQNDFVSLTNPLYPTGPRLNFSIDFDQLTKDQGLFREIFGFPAPVPSPPPPTPVATVAPALATPATPSTGGTVPAGSTPSTTTGNSGSSQGSSSGSSTGSQATSGGSQATSGTATPPTTATTAPPPAPTTATLTAFDGYLSNCQVVLGSAPGTDGNFQKVQDFQAVILNGVSSISLAATTQYNNSVSYIIPASKNVEYTPLTEATASQAQFCYDIATLLPVYNPVASLVVAGVPSMSANAITTLAIFGQALGATVSEILGSLGINIPAPYNLWTYDAIAMAANGSSAGQAFMQSNSAVQNVVTSGANLLSNSSSMYATYAIYVNQALAQKVLYSPATASGTTGRKLLQASSAPAVDLSNATTVASIYSIALGIAQASGDQQAIAALNAGLSGPVMTAVAQAVANLNAATNSATSVVTTQLSTLWGEDYLASEVADLATGTQTIDEFNSATSTSAITTALAGTLPGTVLPVATAPAAVPASSVTPQTQSSSTQSSESSKKSGGGLSHGGKVALATVFPIVAVIAIVAIAAFFISRRNSQSESSSNVWYRRPFARSSTNV